MSKAGQVIENPVTGERVVVRVGTEESEGKLLVVEAFVKPGGAVTGEHVHPAIEEHFTVVRGRVGFRLDGRETIAQLGQRLHVPAGMAHDWWNAGEEEALVTVEIRLRSSSCGSVSEPPRSCRTSSGHDRSRGAPGVSGDPPG